MKKRLVIGGPLDGETISVDTDIIDYPISAYDHITYIKKDLGVSNGPDGKNYKFFIPEDWDVFNMMDHIMENYSTELDKAE